MPRTDAEINTMIKAAYVEGYEDACEMNCEDGFDEQANMNIEDAWDESIAKTEQLIGGD